MTIYFNFFQIRINFLLKKNKNLGATSDNKGAVCLQHLVPFLMHESHLAYNGLRPTMQSFTASIYSVWKFMIIVDLLHTSRHNTE